MSTKKNSKKPKKNDIISSTVAKSQDGNIQITFKIPYSEIKKHRKEAIAELGKNLAVPGFRKGNAPVEKVEERLSNEEIIQATLNKILPKTLTDVITKEKLRIATYPKFELISAKKDEDWQVRVLTCEFPEVDLNNYKKAIEEKSASNKIWTPDKGDEKEEKKEVSQQQKEEEALKILLSNSKANIPSLLINEEVNSRLSTLLERTEKLGLTLENYLSSIGKTSEGLREEYKKQVEESIKTELVLNKIAEEEKIEVEEKEIDDIVKASAPDKETTDKLNTPQQRRIILSILKRKKALEKMASLL